MFSCFNFCIVIIIIRKIVKKNLFMKVLFLFYLIFLRFIYVYICTDWEHWFLHVFLGFLRGQLHREGFAAYW